MARLQIEFRGASTVVHLGDGTTTVGRSNRCTIHLPDPDLADVHFRIQAKGTTFRLKDDGSGSGTRINGKTVFATSLAHGDVIEAGSLRCTFLSKKRVQLTQTPRPEAPPEAVAPPAIERRPRAPELAGRKLPVGLIALGIAGVIVVVAVLMMLSKQKNAAEEANRLLSDADEYLQQADKQASSKALAEALANLQRIHTEFGSSSAANGARLLDVRAGQLKEMFGVLDSADVALRGSLTPEQALEWIRRVAPLTDAASDAIRIRIALTLDQLGTAQRAKAESEWIAADANARTQEEQRQFGSARSAWLDYRTDDALCRRRADEALVALDARVSAAYRGLLRLAAKASEIDGRIGLLEASRPTFDRTLQASDLEVRISALHARKRQAQYIVVSKKRPTGTTKKKDAPSVPSGPYVEPDKVAELLKARKHAAAAALLQSISRHPIAKIRIEELTLQAALFSDLAAKAEASPATFTGILLPNRLGRANAVGADKQGLRVALDGKPRAFSWQELPAKSYVKLFRQAGFHKPMRLGVALFFEDETLLKEAERAYIDFFESEQAPTTFTRIYSHRLGIEPPDGGFVLFRKKLLTPPQRDRILLAERIAKLVKDATRASDARRDAIWTELESIGAPAQDALAGSIRARRSEIVIELRKSIAFSPSRYSKLFGTDLKKYRAAALAFILNPQAYPYPNKSAAAQQRAEELVNKVRALWETPYALLLKSSEKAKALDSGIRGLDDRLARADPLATPVYEEAVAAVLKKLDVRTIAVPGFGDSQIRYNLAVMEYNTGLKNTTVQKEERANVGAVNAYRWMMGLNCVKIDERLVRAARKHSIEMKEGGYFAHQSPTPHLGSPGQRAKREGYGGGVGENIARGASTGVGAFWQWFRSSGHHRNMLSGWTDLGCGACDNHWWTQNFGRATGKSLTPPTVPPDRDPPGSSGK